MWETGDLRGAEAEYALPDEAKAMFRQLRQLITHRTDIVWGEHCTECVYPSCYANCSFYSPREDFNCRRFLHGIERLRDPELDLVRIQFKRWGKLEGRAPLGLKPTAVARGLEWLDRSITSSLSRLPRRLPGNAVWRLNTLTNRIKQRASQLGRPVGNSHQFVVETWHDGSESIPFTLTLLPSSAAGKRMYQTALSLAPGYTRTCLPASEIMRNVSLQEPCLIQLEPVTEGTPPITFGVLDFVWAQTLIDSASIPKEPNGKRPQIKCVIWDLDNTIWKGTLVEDGLEGVTLVPHVVDAIKALDARGILNSIASKNDRQAAVDALTRFGLIDYFVSPQISWNPKSEAIRQIATHLDLGTDTFAFIDDQAFERGEVHTFYPEVEILPETAVDTLLQMPRFNVPVTAESSRRRLLYKTEEQRLTARASSGMDYDQFLRECHIRLKITPLSAATLLRVYELSQRTNQLNISGRRYTRDELETLLTCPAETTYVLSCADRFGDYGIIGFCVLNESTHGVESFFMSCRVQRKFVENAFFSMLSMKLAESGIGLLRINFRKTPKNAAAVRMLLELGFKYEPSEGEESGQFVRPVMEPVPNSEIVTIEEENL